MTCLPEDPLLLPRLLIGLEALREQFHLHKFYPYPGILSVAWNTLVLRLLSEGKVAPPESLSGLLTLCTHPVEEWFPASLPLEFSPRATLLFGGGGIELTDTASYYLAESIERHGDVRNIADTARIERALQNSLFAGLLLNLREAVDRNRAQKDYVILRRFLITRPFATAAELRVAFMYTSIKPSEVGAFYRDCRPEGAYYSCANCGPLRYEKGRWRGAKPDVCNEHSSEHLPDHKLEYRDGLRYLCAAIHERVCLHGIEEVRWLDAAHSLKENQTGVRNALTLVEDWPDIDTCDLRLTFADGSIWAADMKDHKDPDRLGKTLRPIVDTADRMSYERAFYVIPDRREACSANYCRRVRQEANLPDNHYILTASEFKASVARNLNRRRVKEKGNGTNNAL